MIYEVFDKANGRLAYTYSADAPIEWNEFPFSLFDHVQNPESVLSEVPPPVYGGRTELTRREFLDLFTPEEQLAIIGLFDTNIYAKRAKLYLDNVPYVVLTDPKTVEMVNGLAALGGIEQSRVEEILRG